jgi:cysteine desulfurase/selenocysteine lyase
MSTAANRVATVVAGFDVGRVREEFPALKQLVHGKPLVYLDNAATTQKPQLVIDAITHFYQEDCSNIHRGVHLLSERATKAYEDARLAVQQFINAADPAEVIFVRGTTEAINLVAHSYGRTHVQAGDAVLISAMEHHSNIVPWQILCEERGARLRVVPMNGRGELLLDEYEKLLTPRTKLVAVSHVSNALGTVNPVRQIIAAAHEHGIPVLVDGAQAVPHLQVDVQELDCDFYAFSGHKMYGPTGVGVLYGKKQLLEAMPPYQGGGDMISSVTFEKTTWNKLPFKFEAGTPHVAGAYGLAAAMDYVSQIGLDRIAAHEHALLEAASAALSEIRCVRLIGTAPQKAAVVSFVMEGIHPHDVGTVLDSRGIAVRTGHHCAEPVMRFMRVPATTRASFGLYNTLGEVERLAEGLHEVRRFFLPHHA